MVYIVTGNSYPIAVFKTRPAAEAFAQSKRENTNKSKGSPHVEWAVVEFKLR